VIRELGLRQKEKRTKGESPLEQGDFFPRRTLLFGEMNPPSQGKGREGFQLGTGTRKGKILDIWEGYRKS